MVDVLAPTTGRFHALARSSPWRWSTLRFTWTSFTGPDGHRPRDTVAPVRAHLRRPDCLRVEALDGTLREVVVEAPADRGAQPLVRFPEPGEFPDTADGEDVEAWQEGRSQVADGPTFTDEGLVATRPWARREADDPMWHNYTFVAALDPVEFADPHDGRIGTRIEDLRAVDHHGRPAWEAVVHPTEHYDPRCPCCSLLLAPGSFLGEDAPAGMAWPDAHWVRLDVATGVCVVAEQVGGSRAGAGHQIVIEAVDEPMDDALFDPPERRRTWSWTWSHD